MVDKQKDENEFDPNRRLFVRGVLVGSALLVGGSALGVGRYFVPPAPTLKPFPRVLLGYASEFKVGQPMQYKYPMDNQPCLIVKLGQKAMFGVGPDQDIVSFSNICQHLGCIYLYENSVTACSGPSFPGGHCPCHGSSYNFLENATVICGPAPRPVPRVILEYDPVSDQIWAVGMAPPTVFGFNTGSDNVAYDLIGGTIIPDGSTATLTPAPTG
jgi:arsenite oxidase small subunit